MRRTTQGHRNHGLFLYNRRPFVGLLPKPSDRSFQFSNLPTFHNFHVVLQVFWKAKKQSRLETWQFHANTMDLGEGSS